MTPTFLPSRKTSEGVRLRSGERDLRSPFLWRRAATRSFAGGGTTARVTHAGMIRLARGRRVRLLVPTAGGAAPPPPAAHGRAAHQDQQRHISSPAPLPVPRTAALPEPHSWRCDRQCAFWHAASQSLANARSLAAAARVPAAERAACGAGAALQVAELLGAARAREHRSRSSLTASSRHEVKRWAKSSRERACSSSLRWRRRSSLRRLRRCMVINDQPIPLASSMERRADDIDRPLLNTGAFSTESPPAAAGRPPRARARRGARRRRCGGCAARSRS